MIDKYGTRVAKAAENHRLTNASGKPRRFTAKLRTQSFQLSTVDFLRLEKRRNRRLSQAHSHSVILQPRTDQWFRHSSNVRGPTAKKSPACGGPGPGWCPGRGTPPAFFPLRATTSCGTGSPHFLDENAFRVQTTVIKHCKHQIRWTFTTTLQVPNMHSHIVFCMHSHY